jgi:hypothetical protein
MPPQIKTQSIKAGFYPSKDREERLREREEKEPVLLGAGVGDEG